MKPLFSIRQKVVLCSIIALPLLYMLFLLATLPPAQYQHIPWIFLLPIMVALTQILTDFRFMGPQRIHIERVVGKRSLRKSHGVMVAFLSLLYCYYLYNTTHSDTISPQWVATAIAVFMVLLGNYQVALGQPKYLLLTFNTPFMQHYGDLVTRSYRLAGRLLFASGLLVMLPIWILPASYALFLVVSLILGAYVLAVLLFGWQCGQRWVQLKVAAEGQL
ncbi:hypothetical protein F1C16_00605 [Hymenobacter sp. NBH84]|uniref:hypothetical protein n=1 Tax=Hymenobacter sp. NBH84 TaxID=2596915 RepID=UPI001628E046|nr:hypothetical protein [Hymenobacter sp. NBH84]QNE38159.1 hypothetical protein F1C16_00605 [Hymenobacter sp. NBH84]